MAFFSKGGVEMVYSLDDGTEAGCEDSTPSASQLSSMSHEQNSSEKPKSTDDFRIRACDLPDNYFDDLLDIMSDKPVVNKEPILPKETPSEATPVDVIEDESSPDATEKPSASPEDKSKDASGLQILLGDEYHTACVTIKPFKKIQINMKENKKPSPCHEANAASGVKEITSAVILDAIPPECTTKADLKESYSSAADFSKALHNLEKEPHCQTDQRNKVTTTSTSEPVNKPGGNSKSKLPLVEEKELKIGKASMLINRHQRSGQSPYKNNVLCSQMTYTIPPAQHNPPPYHMHARSLRPPRFPLQNPFFNPCIGLPFQSFPFPPPRRLQTPTKPFLTNPRPGFTFPLNPNPHAHITNAQVNRNSLARNLIDVTKVSKAQATHAASNIANKESLIETPKTVMPAVLDKKNVESRKCCKCSQSLLDDQIAPERKLSEIATQTDDPLHSTAPLSKAFQSIGTQTEENKHLDVETLTETKTSANDIVSKACQAEITLNVKENADLLKDSSSKSEKTLMSSTKTSTGHEAQNSTPVVTAENRNKPNLKRCADPETLATAPPQEKKTDVAKMITNKNAQLLSASVTPTHKINNTSFISCRSKRGAMRGSNRAYQNRGQNFYRGNFLNYYNPPGFDMVGLHPEPPNFQRPFIRKKYQNISPVDGYFTPWYMAPIDTEQFYD